MATTFVVADDKVRAILDRRLRHGEPELHEAGVRVGVLMAFNPDGPAVKHGGYPVAACIKVVSLKDRVTKGYDAEMLIDESLWDELRPAQREALVAHELRHIRRVPATAKAIREGGPAWKLDDIGRPKLKSVPADWNAGDGFRDIVAEFGDNAIEYDNIRRAWAKADEARAAGEAAA